MMFPLEDESHHIVKTLNEAIWERRIPYQRINLWLDNFQGSALADAAVERRAALFLLTNLLYFGSKEVRQMLATSFHANVQRSIVSKILRSSSLTPYSGQLNNEVQAQLAKVRFLGVGNPSESGTHLLYYYRQENQLRKELFIHADQIFSSDASNLADPTVDWYIFLDDFCGSGVQVGQRLAMLSERIKSVCATKKVSYHMLVATSRGLEEVRKINSIDDHSVVLELDSSFRLLEENSRFLADRTQDERDALKRLCSTYGQQLWPAHPLGYKNCQLAMSFHHNTPDNSLPIFWCSGSNPNWSPVLDRYLKLEYTS